MHAYRTHTCGQLRAAEVGKPARLSGWVHRKRDHGQLLFIDLRDHHGITQCVINAGSASFEAASALRLESVVTMTGTVVARGADAVNPKLPTGEVELAVDELRVEAPAEVLPLQVASDAEFPEDTRLRYRFLDLRREKLHKNILLRAQVIASIRRRMIAAGFTEFQTPILTSSSPEGARDYLVPSRIHPGKFYALPQAPQQFKQLLMVAGLRPLLPDRALLPGRGRAGGPLAGGVLPARLRDVLRDPGRRVGDDRARAPRRLRGVRGGADGDPAAVPAHPVRGGDGEVRHRQAGSAHPDRRTPTSPRSSRGRTSRCSRRRPAGARWCARSRVRGRRAGRGASSTSWTPGPVSRARPGLGYVSLAEAGARGPIAKFLDATRLAALQKATGTGPGDVVFFVCDKPAVADPLAGKVRTRLGEELDLIEKNAFRFCWITDFPMYEWDEDAKKIDFSHNPFSMPQGGLEALETQDPLTINAYQYDIVCNGIELSSGAIRNHRPDIMYKAFEIAGYRPEEVEARFGGMLNAFRYGAPPHGGSAPGIDRIVMMLADERNLREVIAFPMNQQAQDLLMQAPSEVDPKRLRELHIKLDLPPESA